jgi:hypothetical protein
MLFVQQVPGAKVLLARDAMPRVTVWFPLPHFSRARRRLQAMLIILLLLLLQFDVGAQFHVVVV